MIASTVTTSTVTTSTMTTAAMFPMLSLSLELILEQIAQEGTTDRAQETMSGTFAHVVSCDTAANLAEEATFTLGHGWSVGVIAGRVLVAGLRRELMRLAVRVVDLLRRSLVVLALLRVSLVIILSLAAIVSWLTLGITGVILAKLSASLSVLEAAMLRWTEAVRSGWCAEVLIVSLLGRVLSGWLFAVALIRWLLLFWLLLAVLVLGGLIPLLRSISALLRRVALGLAALLLVALVVALLAVLIIGT